MSTTSTPAESSNSLPARLLVCWRWKATLAIGLTVIFSLPYVYLAHHAFFPVRTFPLSTLDRLAGFEPGWVWLYQSVYLLTGTLPWLATRREQLDRYLFGFFLLAAVSFATFVLLPVRAPRPAVESASGLYGVLLAYDGPYNAFPSLHAGFLYYTLAFAWRVAGPISAWIPVTLVAWAVLILWSTLATKEHYAVDLVAGIALAAGCDFMAWLRRGPARA